MANSQMLSKLAIGHAHACDAVRDSAGCSISISGRRDRQAGREVEHYEVALQELQEFTRAFVQAAEAAKEGRQERRRSRSQPRLPGKYRDYDMANAKADVQRVYEELASAR